MSKSEASGSEARSAATARPVHGTIGSLEAFDPKTDTVAAYAERAELYMDANDMPEARRVATFLNCVGKTTYAIIRNLMIPDKPAEKSLKDIIAVMEKHFEPKPLVIYIRKIQVQQTRATPVRNSIRVRRGTEKALGTL